MSIEFLVKAGYSSVIRLVTHQKFGIQDDVVCATIAYSATGTDQLLCAPHYQPFTRKLLLVLGEEENNKDFIIKDIADNNKIALTYKEMDDREDVYKNIELLDRHKEIQGIVSGKTIFKNRVTVLIPVGDIRLLYSVLKSRGITVDHFYDY